MHPRPLISHAPTLLLGAATIGFGAGNVLAKVILDRGVSALELLPVRYLFAIVTLVGVLGAAGRLKRLDKDTWKKGSVLGIVNMAAPSILLTIGLEHLSVSVTALLVGLIPLTTVAFAHYLIDGENMRTALLPGFILALIGSGLLIETGGEPGKNPILGFSLVGLGVVAAGAGGALTRRFAIEIPAAELVLPQFAAAAVLVFVASLASGSLGGIGEMDASSWGLTAMLGVAATTLPFGALLWLSELATAARAALVAYLVPLVGVAGGVLILDEPLGPRLLFGGTLIMVGVVLAARAERTTPVLDRVKT